MRLGGPPIFVVGTPRSGTTLLAAMLDAHPRLDCGPESRFFARYRHVDEEARRAMVDPARWPGPAVDFVCGIANQGHPVHELYGLSRDEVRAWLAKRPPSLAAILESLTAQRATRNGKARWVEKTPRHVAELGIIRRTWHDAHIVRIVRDPRDVALSLSRMPFATDSVVANLIRVDHDDRASRDLLARDPRAHTLRYEDLVADAERELRRLCEAIGEDFDPAMLEARSAEEGGVVASHEWWKRDVGAPLDPSRSGRWRTGMEPRVQRFAALHLASFLDEHGYEGARTARGAVAIVPAGDLVGARSEELLLRLAERDVAVLRPTPRTPARLARQRALVFCGLKGQLDPFRGAPPLAHSLGIARLATTLVARRLRGRPAPWVSRLTLVPRHPRDPGERAVALLVRTLGRAVPAAAVPDLLEGELR